MKTMNGVRILFALAALAAVQIDAVKTKKTKKVQPVSAEQKNEAGDVLDEVRNDLEDATNEAARQITNVTIAKNKIRKAVVDGTMTQDAAAVMIADYDGAIATIKKDLMEKADQAMAIADETEEQASYMSQFIGGAKSLGAGILAPFRAGYGYSEQEKNLARAVIAELEALKKDETDQAVIQKLDDEIYQQQLISGDAMGTRQKLLIGAAMVAAGVAGYALSGYFGGSELDQSPVNLIPGQPSVNLTPGQPPVGLTPEQPPVNLTAAQKEFELDKNIASNRAQQRQNIQKTAQENVDKYKREQEAKASLGSSSEVPGGEIEPVAEPSYIERAKAKYKELKQFGAEKFQQGKEKVTQFFAKPEVIVPVPEAEVVGDESRLVEPTVRVMPAIIEPVVKKPVQPNILEVEQEKKAAGVSRAQKREEIKEKNKARVKAYNEQQAAKQQ